MRIRRKLLLAVSAPILLVYVVVGVREFNALKRRAIEDKRELAQARATSFASRFNSQFRQVAQVAQSTASFLTLEPEQSEAALFRLIDAAIEQEPHVFGACIAFEPGAFDGERELFAPYGHRTAQGVEHMDIGADAYDYREWEWYSGPRDARAGVWTEPYFDEGAGNVLMCTHSAPFYGRGGLFRGVATVDVQLAPMQEAVTTGELMNGGFLIVSRQGRFISHPDPGLIMTTLGERAEADGQPLLLELQRSIEAGESGFLRLPDFPLGRAHWVYSAPIASAGWSFVAITPESAVLRPVYASLARLGASLVGGLIVMLLAIVLVSFWITRPIHRLADAVRTLATGEMSARVVGVTSKDEFGELATGFNAMVERLDEHVHALSRESAAREAAEGQLRIASEVQRSLLPREQLLAPGYDIAGWNEPADETGGDYYDWQPLSDGRWAISIADVTGHGIGPALVTAFCRAYSRAILQRQPDLGASFREVNRLIHSDLSAGKFVTFAVAVIEPASNQMQLLSAGQAPILHYRSADGSVDKRNADDVPLGVMRDAEYGPAQTIVMDSGDVLVLITDGYFEWMNGSGEQFGTDRLADALRECAARSPQEIIAAIYKRVTEFAQGAPAADDLTIVVVKRTGARA